MFDNLGIGQIIDFRTTREREHKSITLDDYPDIRLHHLEISSGSMGAYLEGVAEMPPEAVDCKSEMIRMHETMLEEAIPGYRNLFSILANSDDPVLMICSTGKDRTGVAASLVLAALGVSRQDIYSDYMLSAHAYDGREIEFARNHGLEALGKDLTLFRDVFTVHAEYLDAAWMYAEGLDGNIETFLTNQLAVDRAVTRRLQDKYLY